jgi:hypothetical protein
VLRSLLLAAALVACSTPPIGALPVTCDASQGGRAGTQTQLRFVEATDNQVVLTFGASSESNDFDVPAFTLEQLDGTTAPRAYRLRVNGTSTLNPDGTASYTGLKVIEPGSNTVRGIAFVDEARRAMTFVVTLERVACPFIAARQYQYGKSPRAQIVLTFGGASSLTLETVSDVVGGAPNGTPVMATGIGYTPGATIRLKIDGKQIWDTVANADGSFDSSFWIPERDPGLYTVVATDGRGHTGTTTLRVMAKRVFIFPGGT